MINLHKESVYLQGARDLLLRLENMGCVIQFHPNKSDMPYNKAIFNEILHNRESLMKFLQGDGWEYYSHQIDKKGKLVSVKVNFIS